MPAALSQAPETIRIPRKRWTRADCASLISTSVGNRNRLELIEGDLIDKMGKKRPHSNTLSFLFKWMLRIFGEDLLQLETPIDVAPEDNPTSEPEPDPILLQRPFWEFKESYPGPSDLRLVVEVSDSTLGFDLTTKARLYARAGIIEYWVVDIQGRRLIVHRDPRPEDSAYASVLAFAEGESVSPLAAPHASLPVADIF